MIENKAARRIIAEAFGEALDDLVRDRMDGLVEEPDITSRLGQRLEERFSGRVLGGYRIEVISQTITSHGRGSLEKPTGAVLYLVISVKDQFGSTRTKGVLVQAKRHDKLDWAELGEQCRRMRKITAKGSVAWIYTSSGVDVIRSADLLRNEIPVQRADQFIEDVLKCTSGDLRRVPKGRFGDRRALKAMLERLGAENAVWLDLERQ